MRLPKASVALTLVLVGSAACEHPPAPGELAASSSAKPEPGSETRAPAEEAPDFGPAGELPARGFGSVTARVPGTAQMVSRIDLVSHKVSTTIQDGLARTEVWEEIENEGDVALEAKLSFALPEGAVLTRLGLVVGDKIIEAELEEKKRIARVFKAIVDDTVRPKDPALLEHVSGSRYSLRIFPVPPKGKRRAVFAYDEILPTEAGVTTYRLPLGAAGARATRVKNLAVAVTVRGKTSATAEGWDVPVTESPEGKTIGFERQDVAPEEDLVLRLRDEPAKGGEARAARYVPAVGELAAKKDDQELPFVALRFALPAPAGAATCTVPSPRLVIVLDTGHGQSRESLRATRQRLFHGLGTLDAATDVRVLACDSACETAPIHGPRPDRRALDSWIATRTPHGSSDVGGALAAGLAALAGTKGGTLLYVGEAAPTSGELSAGPIVARLAARASEMAADVLFLGEGRGVDDTVTAHLARGLGGARVRGEDVAALGPYLLSPRVRELTVDLPDGISAAPPRWATHARVGEEIVVLARAASAVNGKVVLKGKVNGIDYRQELPVAIAADAPQSPLVAKLWMKARIDELEQSGDPARIAEAVALSKRSHVMSRHTSLVAMENDAMFAAYGIQRTTREATDQSDASWGSVGAGFGAGGLGLSGVGEGGGGKGGAVGNMWGAGTGARTAQGFGSAHGRLEGATAGGGLPGIGASGDVGQQKVPGVTPQLRAGGATVSGKLPPEVVQRIVRQQFGRFRQCYQRALASDPSLEGRVVIRFAISADGTVSLANVQSSTVADSSVGACVAAGVRSLQFPQPEGGQVTVVFPITFTQAAGGPAPSRSWQPPPTVTHVAGADGWMQGDDASLEKLRAAVAANEDKRTPREELVKGLVLHGRFAEARKEATELTVRDPDSALAWSLLAESAALTDDVPAALAALDTAAALDPTAPGPHRVAGKAHAMALDAPRACAHFRALASLSEATDGDRAESIRCRAVVLGERPEAIAEGRAMARPAAAVAAMVDALEKGEAPVFRDSAPAGAVTASLACEGDCPRLALITPRGRVISAATPSSARCSAQSLSGARQAGAYRTLLLGKRSAEHTVKLGGDESIQTFRVAPEGPRTVAVSTFRDLTSGFGWTAGRLR